MRLKKHVPLFESTLKHVVARPLLSSRCGRCRYATSSAAYPENIAVLGGGISGLASAHFVAKEFPKSKITIYEANKEAGGWIRSRKVDVPGGSVLFEYGPRTLRPTPSSKPTGQLIQDLGLASDVIVTRRDAPGATNRYIYYPDRLVKLPSPPGLPSLRSLIELFRSGAADGVFSALTEPWWPRRDPSLTDESVGAFISRRVDKRVAQNLVSAVYHGIYAGDIWKLSVKTLMPLLWQHEGRSGSIAKGMHDIDADFSKPDRRTLWHPYDLASAKAMHDIEIESGLKTTLDEASVYSFKGGLQQLVHKLKQNLEKNKNVDIKLDSPVQSFKMVPKSAERVKVVAGHKAKETTKNFDLVISTLRHKPLTEYVTVMTVNLYFSQPNLIPVQGFGYLIPQSVPLEQNPERALGVIFDSDAISGQDTAPGTKLTVMLGGHWWSDWPGHPSEAEGLEMARSVIERHLGITAEPAASHARLWPDCIPQYTVGYEDRLKEFATSARNEFKGRVRLVGNQYNGVGVNDCVGGAWLMARGLRNGGWRQRSCGLDRALDERPWVVDYAASYSKPLPEADAKAEEKA
ncbi:hypothetical protein BDV95DRAFT_589011 [Massariosphaeria phaeospora]|uniref:Protoporphyrinogen oxidase n=1 Tax=Massariosphaeria phaeospora TaxID=100035 RepID=A0A7C8IR31_9PLEO|nr:hypothetical protein BDV95DRAFT_589011 [Massariosphaeria phaeospora]